LRIQFDLELIPTPIIEIKREQAARSWIFPRCKSRKIELMATAVSGNESSRSVALEALTFFSPR
jgi:hypothetical protein